MLTIDFFFYMTFNMKRCFINEHVEVGSSNRKRSWFPVVYYSKTPVVIVPYRPWGTVHLESRVRFYDQETITIHDLAIDNSH